MKIERRMAHLFPYPLLHQARNGLFPLLYHFLIFWITFSCSYMFTWSWCFIWELHTKEIFLFHCSGNNTPWPQFGGADKLNKDYLFLSSRSCLLVIQCLRTSVIRQCCSFSSDQVLFANPLHYKNDLFQCIIPDGVPHQRTQSVQSSTTDEITTLQKLLKTK